MSVAFALQAESLERKSSPPGALILGGAHGSLAVARSLGRQGVPVWFVTSNHPIARYSRYTARSFRWAGPDAAGAFSFLLDLAVRHRLDGWMLIAGGDEEMRLIARHRAELSKLFQVTSPEWETARWAYDKRLTYQRAAALGINCPKSFNPRSRQDVEALECRFPVILKPAVHEKENAFTQAKAWQANDRAALLSRYDQAVALVGEEAIVLQELIPGDGATQFSYAAVWDRGSPVASLVARRTRQYPIDFGFTSTFVETVEQPEVEETACRFLQSLNFNGPVEVEFKLDRRDGRYKLLDVNARVWTWIALGALAGVDFPTIQWRLAMGENVPQARGRPGVAWMHGSRDIVAACHEMLRRRLTPAGYLKSIDKPWVSAAFAADDLKPGLLDLPIVARRLVARRMPVRAQGMIRNQRSRVNPSH
jgi:predicted ATP-grasp superfamily ATP-dependent carboligase